MDCGNTLLNGAVISPGGISDCSMTCSGNSSEFCGAGNRLDVYKQGYKGSTATVSSVIISSTSSTKATTSSSKISTSSSTKPSTSSSKSSTSTKASSSSTTNKVSSTSSTKVSSSSASATPTGPVVVQSVGNYVTKGCWTEGNGVRALTPGAYAYDTMTVESCAASCAGYTYFGVEYGRECEFALPLSFTGD